MEWGWSGSGVEVGWVGGWGGGVVGGGVGVRCGGGVVTKFRRLASSEPPKNANTLMRLHPIAADELRNKLRSDSTTNSAHTGDKKPSEPTRLQNPSTGNKTRRCNQRQGNKRAAATKQGTNHERESHTH